MWSTSLNNDRGQKVWPQKGAFIKPFSYDVVNWPGKKTKAMSRLTVLHDYSKKKEKSKPGNEDNWQQQSENRRQPSHIHSHAPDVRRTRSTFSITNCDIVHAWQAVLIFQRATKALDSVFFFFFFPERDAVGGHTQALIFKETGNLTCWVSCEVSNICYLPSKKLLAPIVSAQNDLSDTSIRSPTFILPSDTISGDQNSFFQYESILIKKKKR